jgi:hypothetical protein
MKKIFVSMVFMASIAVVNAQTGQATTTETKQKTHVEHKRTTTTKHNNDADVNVSVTKKHHAPYNGKHRAAVKQTKTTTTTTTTNP